MPERAAVYCRISRAPDGGTSLGTQRQEVDCRKLAEAKGWSIAEVLVDDDVSAYVPGRRVSYARLVEGIKEGRYDAVVVYDLDRLHRHPWELEEFFRACDAAGVTDLASVAGDFDLATNDGRLMARIMGAVAKKASDDASRRLRRKATELAERGRYSGGPRPYGYRPVGDGQLEVVPEEAAVVREVAERVVAGESLTAVASDLVRQGVPAIRGRWTTTTLRQLLTGGAIAARRVHRGEIVGGACWEPIVDDATFRRLRARLVDGARPTGARAARRYLLTGGIARCGECDRPLGAQVVTRSADKVRVPAYMCKRTHPYDGCGHVHCVAGPLELRVARLVIAEVETQRLAPALGDSPDHDDDELVRVIAAAEAQLVELAELWSSQRISRDEWLAARRPIESRLEAARRRQAVSVRTVTVEPFLGRPGVLGAKWESMSLGQQRAVVEAVAERVVVGRARSRAPRFDPGRVSIEWR